MHARAATARTDPGPPASRCVWTGAGPAALHWIGGRQGTAVTPPAARATSVTLTAPLPPGAGRWLGACLRLPVVPSRPGCRFDLGRLALWGLQPARPHSAGPDVWISPHGRHRFRTWRAASTPWRCQCTGFPSPTDGCSKRWGPLRPGLSPLCAGDARRGRRGHHTGGGTQLPSREGRVPVPRSGGQQHGLAGPAQQAPAIR